MKIEELTQGQKNKFWTLFIGECWHEYWSATGSRYACEKCGLESKFMFNPNFSTISGFEKVWKFIENKYPKLWRAYLWKNFLLDIDDIENNFNRAINLDNILTFLVENNNKWGWEEYSTFQGRLQHPALQYLESE